MKFLVVLFVLALGLFGVLFSFLAIADSSTFSTQSIESNLSLSLLSPSGNINYVPENFVVSLSDADENVTCDVWGNWSSWNEKGTGNNTNLNNGTYYLNISDVSGFVHNNTYAWAINCSSESNSSDYKFSSNQTFTYFNQTILDQDSFENDNNYSNAKDLSVHGYEQEHSIYPAGDIDYISFNATQGANYLIRTGNLKGGVDTILTLYDVNGTSQLEQNDDVEAGVLRWSQIAWTGLTSDTYYLKVEDFNTSNTGNYTLQIVEYSNLNLSFINFSNNYSVQQNDVFTVKLNVTCNGGGCTNIPIYLDPKPVQDKTENENQRTITSQNKKIISKADSNLVNTFNDLNSDDYLDVIVLLRDDDFDSVLQTSGLEKSNSDSSFRTQSSLVESFVLSSSISSRNKLASSEKRKRVVESGQEKIFKDLGIVSVKKKGKINDKKLFRILSRDVEDLDGFNLDDSSDLFASEDSGIIIGNMFTQINGFSAKINKEGFEQLLNDDLVSSIQLSEVLHVTNDDVVPLVNADDVWQEQVNGMNITGEGQTICIVDTGIAYNHSDFGGQNFFPNDKVIGGWDFVNNDADPFDDNWHGTHCAGSAAGESSMYTGVAPGANLVAVKACDSTGSCTGENILAGIDWCIYHAQEYNISTISLSLGGGSTHWQTNCDSDSIAKAINYANNQGIFVSVAAGNDDWSDGVSLPACASGAMTVSAIKKDDSSIGFNRGNLTDILSVGYSVVSTLATGGYASSDGTSMATPQVAGAAALLNQYYTLYDGAFLHSKKIKNSLKESGPSRYDSGSGLNFTRMDVLAALNEPVSKGIISTTIGATPFYVTNASPQNTNPQYVTLNNGDSIELTWNVNATGDYATYEFFAFASLEEIKSETLSETKNVSIVDITVPIVEALSPANDTSINSSQGFFFNISDEYGVSFNCDLYIDGSVNESGVFTLGENNFSISLPDGSYDWYVNCSDEAGSSNSSEERLVFTTDNVAPEITLLEPENNFYVNDTTGPFIFTAEDESYAVKNCSLFIDGVSVYTNTSVIENVNITSTQTLTDGSHSWNVLCFDTSLQNNNATTQNRTLTIDLTKPNTSISLSGTLNESGWYTTNPQLSFTVNETQNDSSPYSTYFNYTGSWQEYLLPVSLLSQGNISMQYYSIDEAGNNETVKVEHFAIDSVNPLQENYYTSPRAATKNNSVTIFINATDSTSGIKNVTASINAAVSEEMNLENTTIYSYTFTPLTIGTYDVAIELEDVAGNKNLTHYDLEVGVGSNGQYNFTENQTTVITNTTSKSNVSINVNSNITGNVSITQYEEQPSYVHSVLANAFRYIDFDASQNVDDAMTWARIELHYSTAEILGYTESTMKLYWYNETSETWVHVISSLDFVNSTGLNSGANYVWANVSHFSTYSIAADKRLCDDHYTDEEISSDCFDETDTLRTSGYMCDHAYQSSECPEDTGGSSGGMGGFSTTAVTIAEDNSSSEEDQPEIAIKSTNKSVVPVPATAKTSTDDLLNSSSSEGNSINSSNERPSFMPETLTLGHKMGFLALLLLIAGFVIFTMHYRDHTHRLSVEHKLNKYLEVNKEEHSEKTLDDWTKDIGEIEDHPKIDLYTQQKNKIKDVDVEQLFSKKN